MSEFGRMYKNALTWGVLAAGLLFRGALAAMDALYRGGSFWQRAAGFWDGTGSVALAALVLLSFCTGWQGRVAFSVVFFFDPLF